MNELDLTTIERLAARMYRSSPEWERWGWEYVDPGLPQPSPALFNEPRWAAPAGPDAQGLEARSAYLRSKAVKRGAIIGGILILAGIPHAAPLFVLAAFVLAAGWFGPLLANRTRAAHLRSRYQAERGRAAADYQRIHGEWERSVAQWDAAEQNRLATADLWFPLGVRSATERVDVFGGTPDGWASLLMVMGASVLRAGSPMLVVDMSENDVAAPLSIVARSQHLPVVRQELPGQLDQTQLLRGLGSEEISELIGEALGTLRAGADDVGLRMLDSDLLKGIAHRLDPPVTFARLVAGLRVLESTTLAGQLAEIRQHPSFAPGSKRVIFGDPRNSGLESALASLAGAVGAAPMQRALRHTCYRPELEVLIALLPEIADEIWPQLTHKEANRT